MCEVSIRIIRTRSFYHFGIVRLYSGQLLFKITSMKLPIELIYKIIEICLEEDLDSSKDILVWTNNLTTLKLLNLNRGINSFIIQHSIFNKLRLWRLLCQIPLLYKPIQLAVGLSRIGWTILEVEVRNERIDSTRYENFLVLDEVTKVYSERNKWVQHYLCLERQPGSFKKKRTLQVDTTTIVPYFEFDEFLINLNSFTCNNLLSIWLWKRFNTTFFKKDILYNMTNHNETNIGFFRPILDTQQKALLAWDRQVVTQNGAFLGLTETVLLHNTELFGRLL